MMYHCRRFSIQLRILNNYLLQHLLLIYRCRFLSYCEIPADLLPVTIARHNAENCWSSSPNKRSSMPYPDFPNLVIIYPPFPEVIAFCQDPSKSAIGCHHPKLLVLLRRGSLCVVVTSANLVVEQITSLFKSNSSVENNGQLVSDLAGFMASLVDDVPSQTHRIMELTNYDFEGSVGYLAASVLGVHSSCISCISKKHFLENLSFNIVKKQVEVREDFVRGG